MHDLRYVLLLCNLFILRKIALSHLERNVLNDETEYCVNI